VEMVGGNFSLKSIPGQGTTIRVEVPLQKADERNRPHATS
jgi:signal transduction histidine kinase